MKAISIEDILQSSDHFSRRSLPKQIFSYRLRSTLPELNFYILQGTFSFPLFYFLQKISKTIFRKRCETKILCILKYYFHISMIYKNDFFQFSAAVFSKEWRIFLFYILTFASAYYICASFSFSIEKGRIQMLDKLALLLTIIGGLNWGSIGIFQFDLVAAIFGGQDAWGSRIVYTVIALAALWCISLFFRDTPVTREE